MCTDCQKPSQGEYFIGSSSTFNLEPCSATLRSTTSLSGLCLSKTQKPSDALFAKVKSVCAIEESVCASFTGYQMASCATQLPSALLSPEGRVPGSRLCVPRDQAPQLGEHKRQRPPRLLEAAGNSRGLAQLSCS